MQQKNVGNLARRRKAERQARRDKKQAKLENIKKALLHTRELEGDFSGPNIFGWGLDKDDNPIRI